MEGLPGTLNISEDIFILGKPRGEHDQNLKNVIQRLRQKILTLNKYKFELGKN